MEKNKKVKITELVNVCLDATIKVVFIERWIIMMKKMIRTIVTIGVIVLIVSICVMVWALNEKMLFNGTLAIKINSILFVIFVVLGIILTVLTHISQKKD